MSQSLVARIVSSRSLVYTDAPIDDRPPHVRAASAIAARGDELFVIQDDAAFIARVRGDSVTSIALPAIGGRRRFETALGNKLDKLDLESCVILDDELIAFGSGTIEQREHVVRMTMDGNVRVDHARELYAKLRDAIGTINIEGVARVGDELWFCHRGNTSASDAPAIARVDRAMSRVIAVEKFDLGRIGDVAIGFTDACGIDDRCVFIGCAEASANAIDDGTVLGSVIGVIDRDGVRVAPFSVDAKPEGIALRDEFRAWVTTDPDDPEMPTTVYEVAISGINRSK